MRERVRVVSVRPRRDVDLDACEELAAAVHRRDGYPPILMSGYRDLLVAPDAIAAWVAEREGRVVGHVALHRRSSAAVMDLARASTGRSADQLAVVARLIVAPDERRRGIARMLLAAATDAARRRGRWPVLDVATRFGGAIALYERSGWTRVGAVTVELAGFEPIDELVYVGPAPDPVGDGTID